MNQAIPRKVGILTFHRCINYGSYWQARCLVEALQSMGHEAILLDHDSPEIRRKEWRCALQPQLPKRGPPGDLAEHASKTRSFLEAFAALPLSAPFATDEPKEAESCDVVMVGSDEVWNFYHPWYGGYPIFFGQDLNAKRLVSYAASFGNYGAPGRLPPPWADLLSGFEAISVRDQNSAQIVRDTVGITPALVLDPCLLAPPAGKLSEEETSAPYVAVYGHGFPRWFAYAARDWAAQRGYRLVSVGYRNDWAHEQWIAAGPERFSSLMAEATAVVTNFFHGCVFAILNAKPFACVSSDYRANKLRDLMHTLGTEDHLVDEATSPRILGLLDTPLDTAVGDRLASLRVRSRDYLQRALAP